MAYRFTDIKKFLENAPVDEYGYYEFGKEYPKYVIQIYHTKHECNIIYKTSISPADEDIIGKLYFDDYSDNNNRVYLYKVTKNIVDFNDRVNISADTTITPILIYKAFHFYGRRMCEAINLILETEYVKI